MTREEALAAITKALAATVGSVDGDVTEDTNLVDDGLLDSLDSMTFLFELENDLGTKLDAIDETYEDFRVGSIVDIVVQATA
jgi:acyl carrier protein